MIGVEILKGRAVCLLKITSPQAKESSFKRYFQKTFTVCTGLITKDETLEVIVLNLCPPVIKSLYSGQ